MPDLRRVAALRRPTALALSTAQLSTNILPRQSSGSCPQNSPNLSFIIATTVVMSSKALPCALPLQLSQIERLDFLLRQFTFVRFLLWVDCADTLNAAPNGL